MSSLIDKDMEIALNQIIQNVNSGLQETVSLDELSAVSNKSKYYLIKKFAANCGLTPHKMEIQIKIRKAQKDIRHGLKLVDVALNNGFYDSSHFNNSFKKITGVTPRKYSSILNSNFLQ